MSTFVLGLLVLLAAGSGGSSYRKPQCTEMVELLACPMNMSPLCGSDGNTYANECGLCVQRMLTNTDIVIIKDGSC